MTAGWLLDTSILSLLAPGRDAPPPDLADWLRRRTDALFVSAVTIAEIEQGVCKLRRAGGAETADRLEAWLAAVIETFGDRILVFDAAVAREAGAISDQAMARGRHPGFADVAIAATAKFHDLVLLTANGRHFAPLGVPFGNPASPMPD